MAAVLAGGLGRLGVTVKHKAFFDTVRVAGTAAEIAAWHRGAEARRMNFRHINDGALGISVDETTSATT